MDTSYFAWSASCIWLCSCWVTYAVCVVCCTIVSGKHCQLVVFWQYAFFAAWVLVGVILNVFTGRYIMFAYCSLLRCMHSYTLWCLHFKHLPYAVGCFLLYTWLCCMHHLFVCIMCFARLLLACLYVSGNCSLLPYPCCFWLLLLLLLFALAYNYYTL